MTILAEKSESEQIQELTNTLFLINGLQSKLSQEAKLIATGVSQLNLAASEFQEYLKSLKRQGEKIHETLNHESKLMGQTVTQEITQHITSTTSVEIDKVLSNLQIKTSSIEQSLSQAREGINLFSRTTILLTLLATLIGGIIGGGIISYLFPVINTKLGAQLEAGEIFLTIWPKLSQKERDKLMALNKVQSK